MTGFDILVLIVVAISALLAFARGFVREALSMAALAIAVLAVLWGFPLFREPVRGVIEPGWLADVATIGALFLLVYVAVRVLTGRIHEWVHDSEPLGILDRTGGLLFGVARGFILLAVGLMVVTSLAPPSMLPEGVRSARFYPFVMITADALKHLAPQAGQAASDMARGAAAAGEDMARGDVGAAMNAVVRERAKDDATKRADSSVDDAPAKAQKAPAEGASRTPDWSRPEP